MIYLDLHGVLIDFVKPACYWHNKKYVLESFTNYRIQDTLGIFEDDFWKVLDHRVFWETLPLFSYSKELYTRLCKLDTVRICTAPAPCKSSYEGTLNLLEREFDIIPADVLFIKDKYLLANEFNSVLIDDRQSNTEKFIEHGGIAYTVARPWNQGGLTAMGCLESLEQIYV